MRKRIEIEAQVPSAMLGRHTDLLLRLVLEVLLDIREAIGAQKNAKKEK